MDANVLHLLIGNAIKDVLRAYEALKHDIQSFSAQLVGGNLGLLTNILDVLDIPEDVQEKVRQLSKYQQWQAAPSPSVEELGTWEDFISQFNTIYGERYLRRSFLEDLEHWLPAQRMDENQWLKSTAEKFLQQLDAAFIELEGTELDRFESEVEWEKLLDKVHLLREITEMWTIYRIGWDQRQDDSLLREPLFIGDRVAKHFYEVAEAELEDLDLEVEQQQLITVLHMNRLDTRPSRFPAPYIVGPYWGYKQPWNLLSYAHEVGHHIYRNVEGLSDELLFKVMVVLVREGYSLDILRIWAIWLEEIFADLFGLLRVGPATIHAAQRLAVWVIPRLRGERILPGYRAQLLLASHDEIHPCSYLRVRLMTEAVKMVQAERPMVPRAVSMNQDLANNWEELSNKPTEIRILERGARKRRWVKNFLEMGEVMLEAMLKTPLYALAAKKTPNQPRSIIDVFYDGFNQDLIEQIKNSFVVGAQKPQLSDPVSEIPAAILTDAEIRHILAAAELALDELDFEFLENMKLLVHHALLTKETLLAVPEIIKT